MTNEELDLYAVLEVAPDTPTDELRTRIGQLYNEALANAEHRDFKKKLHYATLLETLPHCYNILLDEERRPLYDAYLAARQSGATTLDFAAYLEQENQEGHLSQQQSAAFLEIRDSLLEMSSGATAAAEPAPATAHQPLFPEEFGAPGEFAVPGQFAVPSAPEAAPSAPVSPSPVSPSPVSGAFKKRQLATSLSPLAGVVVFVLAVVLLRGVLQMALGVALVGALLAAAGAAAACYFALSRGAQ